MDKRLFLAGASGAIGRRIIPMLLDRGWTVMGMTRDGDRAGELRALGIEAAVVDAYDEQAVADAVTSFRPDVVMHQMTDLPRDLAQLDDAALERNARIRHEGTRSLVKAALAARARRLVAQSICFSYAPARLPHVEEDLLAGRLNDASPTAKGVVSLEDQVVQSGIPAVILRYGKLYGPGTGSDRPWGKAGLHVDAAAQIAVLAAESEETGIFNVAEDDGEVDSTKARLAFGWSPEWRLAP